MTQNPSAAYLIAQAGGLKRVFALTKDYNSAGRTGPCDVKLPFGTVSRAHAAFVRTPGGFKVVDSGSHNGVLVNGVRVAERQLSDGDSVQIGEVVMMYTTTEPADPVAPPKVEVAPPVEAVSVPTAAVAVPPPPPAKEPRTRRLVVRTDSRGINVAILLAAVGMLIVTMVSLFSKPAGDTTAIRDELKRIEEEQNRLLDELLRKPAPPPPSNLESKLEQLSARILEISNRLEQLQGQVRALEAALQERSAATPGQTPPEAEPPKQNPTPTGPRTPGGRKNDEEPD